MTKDFPVIIQNELSKQATNKQSPKVDVLPLDHRGSGQEKKITVWEEREMEVGGGEGGRAGQMYGRLMCHGIIVGLLEVQKQMWGRGGGGGRVSGQKDKTKKGVLEGKRETKRERAKERERERGQEREGRGGGQRERERERERENQQLSKQRKTKKQRSIDQTKTSKHVSGNCCILKPSEMAENVAILIEELVPKYLDSVILSCLLHLSLLFVICFITMAVFVVIIIVIKVVIFFFFIIIITIIIILLLLLLILTTIIIMFEVSGPGSSVLSSVSCLSVCLL